MTIGAPPVSGRVAGGDGQFDTPWKRWIAQAQNILFILQNFGILDFEVPANGFNITFPQNTGLMILNPAGPLAAGTIVFPQVSDKQQITIATTQAITALTLVPASGDSISNPISSLGAGSSATFYYKADVKTWYNIGGGSGGSGGGGGTVTSVGLVLPTGLFTVAGSPVTGSGTLEGDLIKQAANNFFLGPIAGANDIPAFRLMLPPDLPTVVKPLVDGATVAVDASFNDHFRIVLGGNRIMGAPSNLGSKARVLWFRIVQPNAGGPWTPTFASIYKFQSSLPLVFSGAPNASDLVRCQYDPTDNTLVCDLIAVGLVNLLLMETAEFLLCENGNFIQLE